MRARPFVLAVVSAVGATIVTRLAWPLVVHAPFAVFFLAVYLTTRFGSREAGLLATALGAIGAPLAGATFAPPPLGYVPIAVFVCVGVVATSVIGDRNDALAALRANEAQFRATWEHSALGAAVLDRHGRVERVNPALERFLGHPESMWTGRPFHAFSQADDPDVEPRMFADLMAGRETHFQIEQPYGHYAGSQRWGRMTLSAILDETGAPIGALMALEDITARRQAAIDLRASEEKLLRAQKMEAVGQLVAGVAHNFNNLLTITGGYADLLLHGAPDEHERHGLQEIRRAAERGAALTRQLLAFSRKREVQAVPIDLNRLLNGMMPLLARAVREDTDLVVDLAPEHATVRIDPEDIEQVILNLVLNARDALPHGGRIRIDLARETLGEVASTGAAEYVRLRIADDGVGMSAEVQAHLFEPFFTTKEVGQGTGLGLAFVYGTVRQHHGTIVVDSTLGAGTTITLHFPREEQAAVEQVEVVVEAPEPGSRRTVTILLVEDEDLVRDVTARALRHAGHRVLEAELPSAAVALFERHAHEIDLLVTDVVMPEMHGPALAERLLAQRPGLPVLFVTGYADAIAKPGDGSGPAVLRKPFRPSQLIDAVAGVLGLPAT